MTTDTAAALKFAADTAEIVSLELAIGTDPAAIATQLHTLPQVLLITLRTTGHQDVANQYRAAFNEGAGA